MEHLLDTTADFSADVFRNIVSLRESRDLFADLSDGDSNLSTVAIQAEIRVKQDIPTGLVNRGFHYTTAISYPFEHEPYLASRYGNGEYGVWYGSTEIETTIHETCHHMARHEGWVEGIKENIVRERAVYLIHCQALLIDLRGKRQSYPWLVGEDYSQSQALGRRIQKEGHPGLLTPSARCDGTNLAAFSSGILSNPRMHCYLRYTFKPSSGETHVERIPGEPTLAVIRPVKPNQGQLKVDNQQPQ